MKFLKRLFFVVTIIVCVFGVWSQTYTFNVEKATKHLTEHGLDHSTHCCAWYTMRALQAGNCPAIILPAQWYFYFMPLVKFKEVPKSNYKAQRGDVVVFERPSGRWWGHIAMYNGDIWISDFKQQHMNPYRKPIPYKIYRYQSKSPH